MQMMTSQIAPTTGKETNPINHQILAKIKINIGCDGAKLSCWSDGPKLWFYK